MQVEMIAIMEAHFFKFILEGKCWAVFLIYTTGCQILFKYTLAWFIRNAKASKSNVFAYFSILKLAMLK